MTPGKYLVWADWVALTGNTFSGSVFYRECRRAGRLRDPSGLCPQTDWQEAPNLPSTTRPTGTAPYKHDYGGLATRILLRRATIPRIHSGRKPRRSCDCSKVARPRPVTERRQAPGLACSTLRKLFMKLLITVLTLPLSRQEERTAETIEMNVSGLVCAFARRYEKHCVNFGDCRRAREPGTEAGRRRSEGRSGHSGH
jgi:hypothetical protein